MILNGLLIGWQEFHILPHQQRVRQLQLDVQIHRRQLLEQRLAEGVERINVVTESEELHHLGERLARSAVGTHRQRHFQTQRRQDHALPFVHLSHQPEGHIIPGPDKALLLIRQLHRPQPRRRRRELHRNRIFHLGSVTLFRPHLVVAGQRHGQSGQQQ